MSNNDYSRIFGFYNFAYSKDGASLNRKIHAMARGYATKRLVEIEPNWHSLTVRFDDSISTEVLRKPVTEEGACRIEFDYRPTSVVLVGPNVGNVDLTKEIFTFIPEPLFVLMRMCNVTEGGYHVLYNPKHVIELLDGKTIIKFENCTSGVVRNVKNDEFDVEDFDERDQVHFTRASLMEGFKVQDCRGQPVDVDYFPLLREDGTQIATVEDLFEDQRRANEAWKADRPRREAEEAVRRAAEEAEKAAAYAALSPEEKERHDARQKSFAAQAEIARALLKVLPGPGA